MAMTSILLPITLTSAGAAALINLWLAIRVGRVRVANKVLMGDGGNAQMIAAMRAHANFTEYTPFVLILVAAIELAAGTTKLLWAVSAVFMVGRVLHGLGMSGTFKQGRAIATGITMLTLAGLGVYAVAIALAR